MNTLMNWLSFACVVYIVGVKAQWWAGPITVYRNRRARRTEDFDDEYADGDDFEDDFEDFEDDDADSAGSGTVSAGSSVTRLPRRTVTHGDGHGRDIEPDMGRDTDRQAETSLDTGRDMGHPNPSPGVWTRVRQAVDLVRGVERGTQECLSTVSRSTPPLRHSPSVTTESGQWPGQEAVPMPPRVVVHYVEPGSWTGQVAGTDDDGRPVVIRYMTRSAIAAPTDQLTRPVSEPACEAEPGVQGSGDALPIDEITVRREWLRTMTASGRFTADEIRDLYVAKWGKTPKTLARDLAAITTSDATGEQGRR